MALCEDYRQLVCWLARHLSEHELKELEYMYSLPQQRGTNPSSSLETLRELEQRGVFSSSSSEGLKRLLKKIEREDLIEEVEKHFEVWERSDIYTTTKITSLAGDLARSCGVVEKQAKSLATQAKKIGVLLEERATTEGILNRQPELPLQELEQTRRMIGELQPLMSDCAEKCTALERASMCAPPITDSKAIGTCIIKYNCTENYTYMCRFNLQ